MRVTSRQHAIVKTFRAIARGSDSHLLLDGWHLLTEADTRRHHRRHDRDCRGSTAGRRACPRAGTPWRRGYRRGVEQGDRRALSCAITQCGRRHRAASECLPGGAAISLAGARARDCGRAGSRQRRRGHQGSGGRRCDGCGLRPRVGGSVRLESAPRVDGQRLPRAGPSARRHARGRGGLAARPACRFSPRPRAEVESIYEVDWRRPVAILVGGEGGGLPAALAESADERISIPMRAKVESLNVAVSAALMIFEAQRQR